MAENFLEIKDLVIEYTSDESVVHAVNGVSLSLKKGQTLGLVGETGAGKTTIAKSIMRILPDPPSRFVGGTITVDGTDIMSLHEREMLKIRGNKIAMIFQDPMTALNPLMPVGKQILEVVQLHNDFSYKEAVQHTCNMLEMVGIPAVRSVEYPHQFSGGMKQRIVIAMALACNPELLLADEPTTALDVTVQAQVLEMIKDLQKKLDTSMLLITHDLGVVAETCDEVAVIYAGQIMECGSKEDLFLRTAHPYTLGLFGSLPKLDDDSKRLSPIKGLPPDPTKEIVGCAFAPRCPRADEACRKCSIELTELSPGHLVRCIHSGKEES